MAGNKKIQDCVVNITLSKISQYDDMEKLLNDVTYETIYVVMELLDGYKSSYLRGEIINKLTNCYRKIIYIFLTIFLYLLKCPQSLILSALRAFCFCGKPHISRSIFLYFRYQAWLKSW